MTRFARAKGSKSSNERAPDDSTPWEVMKEQLLQSKKEKEESGMRQQAENQRIANYENFLKEQKVAKRKATWCDFPETTQSIVQPKKKKEKPDQNKNQIVHQDSENNVASVTGESSKKKKKKKNKIVSEETSESNISKPEIPVQVEKKEKKKNKKKKNSVPNDNAPSVDTTGPKTSDTINIQSPNQSNSAPNQQSNNNATKNKKGNKKTKNGKPVRRKEINDNSFQIIINGKPVELVRFDGFPVMKKDGERLAELKSSMIKKGIPKSEVQRTMKLERRRAEKALARVRREVCYNCRKGGHNLSDCPDLKSKIPGVDTADGVCFKCGSTEHRQFECKVQREGEFRFASCFICREQGHIARQCPDNPKGLYPNGGSCKLCGDVTHLRKDCPTVQGQREETSMKLETLQSADNIEDIGSGKVTNPTESVKKQPKKIRF